MSVPEVAYPAMYAQLRQHLGRKWTGVGSRNVSGDMTQIAHARDDRGDSSGCQAEAQCQAWQFVEGDAGIAHDGLYSVPDFLLSVAAKIVVAEIAFWKLCV